MKMRMNNPTNTAFKKNRENALKNFDKENALDEVTKKVVALVLEAMKANEVASAESAEFVQMMRSLGGWSEIINQNLPTVKDESRSAFGVPMSAEFYQVEFLKNHVGDIRNRAVIALEDYV